MDQVLEKQLSMQIEQQLEAKILAKKDFTIPYSVVQVTYTPIIKKRMDILMKMLLTSYRSGAFTDAEQLASILMVEPLFINDLTRQMEKSKLISTDESYSLTAKGESQLKQGIYEEQLPDATVELFYSKLHECFFTFDIDTIELEDDLPDPLQYLETEEQLQLNEKNAIETVQQLLQEVENEQLVQSIHEMEEVELYDFPVKLFICYDRKTDRLFSRAYNIYLNEWDDSISSYLDKQEVVQWRSNYL